MRFRIKLEVLTANIGSGRVRHLDVRCLCTQEAVQAGRFTLKMVGTTQNVSDLTTKYHDEERLDALMRTVGLRYKRGLRHAALVAGESRPAAVNVVLRTQASELDENILRLESWIEVAEGRVAGRSRVQHTSKTLIGCGSDDLLKPTR